MAEFTKLTNLEVTGSLKASGGMGLTKATYQSDSTKTLPSSAAGSYSSSDEGKIIAALDDLRTKYDALVAKLAEGTDPS